MVVRWHASLAGMSRQYSGAHVEVEAVGFVSDRCGKAPVGALAKRGGGWVPRWCGVTGR
ncbi:putative pollen-specific leucine-rich repeat extensin-like protein 3 [Iris pallida]|uniref:Pollen-specific leucine-rich repeat extensin-like protein 3 n=1 Tax=Iris pallida TaxID=29817 RepID=A0AAX6E2Y4_IRIPA|nr:putative pollen-specific leucine-rich repeat extensin-like protein 3 [Iris pallida]KAJ6806654.1 putative pollen-specific leucine-rich repeat extensin-like protein 3 [Iris pallida]